MALYKKAGYDTGQRNAIPLVLADSVSLFQGDASCQQAAMFTSVSAKERSTLRFHLRSPPQRPDLMLHLPVSSANSSLMLFPPHPPDDILLDREPSKLAHILFKSISLEAAEAPLRSLV